MRKPFVYFILFISLTIGVFAQTAGLSDLNKNMLIQDEMMNNMLQENMMKGESIAFGNVVNPDFYYCGPGDILSIQNITASTKPELTVISPEISVYLPRLGSIDIKGKTLSEARDTIIQVIKKQNPNAIAFVTLYRPRMVLVTVKGNVLLPDTYTFPATYKVSTALKLVNKLNGNNRLQMQRTGSMMKYLQKEVKQQRNYAGKGISYNASYSSRNIVVHHQDGTSSKVDIEKAYVYPEENYDPYIRDCDEIIVPYEPEDYPIISISGEVLKPAILAFKPGDNVAFLLKYAAGFSDYADTNDVNLYTISGGQTGLQVDQDMNLIGNDAELSPGSMIIIGKKMKDNEPKQGVVSVSGHVNKEGGFIITPNVTKLSEVIDMAGGFTDKAYLPLAYILRRDINEFTLNNGRDLKIEDFRYSDLTLQDTTRYFYLKEYQKNEVSCDFEALFNNHNSKLDITLQDGDIIVVPDCPKTIFVFGRVVRPGYIPFTEGKNLQWYINQAGGYTQDADDDRARIIRGKNKVWLEGGESVRVFAGDEIYVPREPDIPPSLETQKYAAYAGITSAALGILNIIYWSFFQK